MTDEERLARWLETTASEAEHRGRHLAVVPHGRRLHTGRVLERRRVAVGSLAAVSVVLVVASALSRPMADPSAQAGSPPVSAEPSTALPTPNLSAGARELLDTTRIAIVDPRQDAEGRWLIGTITGGWRPLEYTSSNAQIRTDWNRVIVTRVEPGAVVIEEVLDDGTTVERYRTDEGITASIIAAGQVERPVLVLAGVDLGVVVVDESLGEAKYLVPGARATGNPLQRGDLLWSPSGRIVASPLCDQLTCVTDIVDLDDLSVHQVTGYVVLAVSDTHAIGYRSEEDRAWQLIDLETGVTTLVASEISAPFDAQAMTGETFVLSGRLASGQGLGFVRLEPKSMASETVYISPNEDHLLLPRLSSDRFVLLIPRNGWDAAIVDQLGVLVLDTETGSLAGDPIVPNALDDR